MIANRRTSGCMTCQARPPCVASRLTEQPLPGVVTEWSTGCVSIGSRKGSGDLLAACGRRRNGRAPDETRTRHRPHSRILVVADRRAVVVHGGEGIRFLSLDDVTPG